MVSSTRSGPLCNSEGTRRLRSRSVGVKVKSSHTSGSIKSGSSRSRTANGNSKLVKSLIPSDSAPADSSRVRRFSGEEPPVKKMKTPSPTGTRKSARLKNESPTMSLEKHKHGRVGNESPSTSLILERNEKYESLSPVLRKSSKHSTSSDEEERENRDTSGKMFPSDIQQLSNVPELGVEDGGVLKKEKRLCSREYRLFLNNQAKKTKNSDAGRIPSGKVRMNRFKLSRKKREELSGREHSSEDLEEVTEGPDFSSSEHADMVLGCERHRELTHCKRKCRGDDADKSNDGDSILPSKCSNNLSSSPPVKFSKETDSANVEQETDAVGNRTESCCSAGEDLDASELMDRMPERGLPVDVVDAENSITDTTTSSYSETRIKNVDLCIVCSRPQRVHNATHAKKLCSCGAVTQSEVPISHTKDICDQAHKLPSPCKDGIARRCSVEEKGQEKENLVLKAGDQLVMFEKQNVDCLVELSSTVHTSVLMEEDMRKPEATNCISITKHHISACTLELPLANDVDIGPNACVICKHPGLLLCCNGKGCKRSYHLSCLDPPLEDFPTGVWLCLPCVKKKLELGVYSVSEGWESVWSFREVLGLPSGKEYFVKYKGLAHVHNHWIPESQILIEAPLLLAKFTKTYQKEKVIKWKSEWTEPQRLLQKRDLMPRKLADEFFSQRSNSLSRCNSEWLVKWKGLGYEDASWELENSPFLCSSEAMMLIKDYEERCPKAKRESDPSIADKALQVKRSPFYKLSKLPSGFPSGLDNDHLSCINRIREYWHKSQNAVLIDDQERIMKSILFILSLQSCTCRPFLIIANINSLSLWETEFIHLAPSINVVLYNGNKDIRKMIQTLEFYEEGGCLMFQVLLSHPEAIVEDLDALDSVGWESIILDECQNPRISKYFESLTKLSSGFRLLLLSGQLKDSLVEYVNLLSFLESEGKETCGSSLNSDSNNNVGMLAIIKERLARYIAYERKSESSKFLEYWVPVWLSNVQLEQYCATLISNLIALRSCSKTDHVGALRDIVISTRKCCDHPYLVDDSLQKSLNEGHQPVEYLNVGVKASGKMQILDKILQQIRNQGLRVLILFQSIGVGKNKIGDFLEDLLIQRFGLDSYERVDSGLIMSKKVSALNKFNDKSMGRFVFLIENRACLPSIRLSSVDAIIIYDSDWNPLNDLKALQKISIESQFDRIKVFRLYTSCTVEEKVLSLAKQDLILDSNIQNISPNVSHSLLSWGASFLFSKLDQFHRNDDPTIGSDFFTANLSPNDVAQELLVQLENNDTVISGNSSILIKALQSGTSYSRNILLIGEKEGITSLDIDPPSFWSNLVEGRSPQWRYISDPSQRTRRKLPYSDESFKVPEAENDESKRKRRRVDSNTVNPLSLPGWLHDRRNEFGGYKDVGVPRSPDPSCTYSQPSLISQEALSPLASSGSQCLPNSAGIRNHIRDNSPMPRDTPGIHKSHMVECELREKLVNAQNNLHLLLKPELSELCETLKLPENVKGMSEKFLDYIMKNHHVNREQEPILQAFKISLCWRAAAFLKHKLDHMETLALAKSCLNFECSPEQAECVYSKLRFLKKLFSDQTDALKNDLGRHSLEKSSCMPSKVDVARPLMHENVSHSVASDHQEPEDGELRYIPDSKMCSEQLKLEKGMNDPFGMIEKLYSDRQKRLLQKQQLECNEFNQKKEQQKKKLQDTRNQALDLICALELDSVARDDKIKQLNQEFCKNLHGFEDYMRSQRTRLAVMHVKARDRERQIKDQWLNECKAGRLAESFDDLPLSESGFRFEEFNVSEQVGTSDCSRGTLRSSWPSDYQCNNLKTIVPVDSIESREQTAEIAAVVSNGAEQDMPVEASSPALDSIESREQTSEIAAVVSNGAEQDMPVEASSPVQTVELIPKNVAQAGADTVLMETELLDSRSTALNEVHDMPEGIVNTGTADTIDIEHHANADNSSGACLISSTQQNRRELPSSSPKLTTSGHMPSVGDHGRPPLLVDLESDECISSAQQSVESTVCSTGLSLQVAETSFQPHLPPAGYVALSHQGGMFSPLGSAQEPGSQILCSTQQSDTSMQQPIGTSADLASSDVSESRNQLPQLFSTSTWIPPQGLHPNAFENELTRLRKQDDTCNKMHEEKKLRIKLDYDQEIEKIRRKYEALFQNAETEYLQEKEKLGTIYSKVVMNRNLADEFRARFVDQKGGNSATFQGPRSSSMQQPFRGSQPQPIQCPVPVTATLPPASNLASFPSGRFHAPAMASPSISSPQVAPQARAVFSSNAAARHHLSPLLPPRTSIQAGSEPRAPAPHLQRFRSQMSKSAQNFPLQSGLMLNQQQSLAQLSSPSPVHVSPVLPSCTSSASASGISQPEASVTLPLPQSTPTDLATSVRGSNEVADTPTLSPLGDITLAFESLLTSNLALGGNRLSNLSNDQMRPSGSSTGVTVDVVCIDDE